MDNLLILERLDRLEKQLIGQKEVLTFDEACDYAGISRSYLYKLTSSGRIHHSKPNGKKLFFEKKKLIEWLLQNNQKSKQELEAEALVYTMRRKVRQGILHLKQLS
ncbi:helix-turn-helix domain-containing protein [Yeosuana marina]|uniref:helix-turn-helix domain-containing protein n=1 Tax=Yeosuana marina TaxID=1565536 RepID=UPI0014229477|nr:helix-turn-helix domain-containing protein [Yeosuana marina]|tara:strand:- start:946 stop:1263 length:318 start_codon:yes stop_codon:yes gene_type:complete